MHSSGSTAAMEAAAATAFCVDLDGTLVATDTLWESLILLAKRRPWDLVKLPIWLFRGRAFFKEAVSRRVALDASSLPYRAELIVLLHEAKKQGREVILATAADRVIAQNVADHLKVFSKVIASTGRENMAGEEKLKAIKSHLDGRPFDYAGDSAVDIPLLEAARQAWLVAPSAKLARRAKNSLSGAQVVGERRISPLSLLKALRVQQWAKNILLFVPLFTAHKLTDWPSLAHVLLGAVAFSLCASSIYIANDLLDLEDDRTNPAKQRRPFASGAVSIPVGVGLCIGLFVASFALAGLALDPRFALILGFYALVSGSYCWFLKRVEILDIMVLVLLYDLRILAGGAAAVIPVSPWMLAFSVFLFASLAFVKRYSELRLLRESDRRPTKGRGYDAADEDLLRTAGICSGYLSVLVLVLYINTPEVTRLYARPHLLWLVAPCLLYWITRAWLLAQRGKMHSDPVLFALKDPSSYATGLFVAIIVAIGSV